MDNTKTIDLLTTKITPVMYTLDYNEFGEWKFGYVLFDQYDLPYVVGPELLQPGMTYSMLKIEYPIYCVDLDKFNYKNMKANRKCYYYRNSR